MRVRIREGRPVEEDIVRVLGEFCDTKFIKNRNEIYLNKCPLCGGSDNRGNGTQGAISYSLTLNCVTCAKCGTSKGWKDTLAAMNVEWEVEGSNRLTLSGIALARSVAQKAVESKEEYVDHGDWKVDVNVAADHHVRRLMSPDSKVRPWLEKRGFRFPGDYAENLNEAWAGECKAGWLVIIYRGVSGEIRGFKYRHIETKEFFCQKGVQSDPYGIDEIDGDNPTVTWVEGELDREALRQAYGVRNVLSLPNGSNAWKPEWVKYMQHARVCYIATDHDDEGEKAAAKMFASIPEAQLPNLQRMARVRFVDKNDQRVKDANDALRDGATKEQIVRCFVDAEDPDLISSERAELNTSGYFIPTTWHHFDEVASGGLLTGEVTHLAGAPKSGKTTIVLDLHQRLSRMGVKTGFVSLDMDTSKIAVRFGMAAIQKDDSEFYRTRGDDRATLAEKAQLAMATNYTGKVMFTKTRHVPTYREALAIVERMARSGSKVITVEDFLSLSVLLESESKGRTVYAGKRIIGDLAQIAGRNACHVILVNHLKVDDRGSSAYGSGQIGPAAQMNIHVSADRDPHGITKATIMHIRENRFGSKADVDIPFFFQKGERILTTSQSVRHKRGKRSEKSGSTDENYPF